MDQADSPLGAIVENTSPALAPGPEALTGHYMRLERLDESHGPGLYAAMAGQASVWTYMADGPWFSASDFQRDLSHFIHASGIVLYTLFVDNEIVGNLSLGPADLSSRVMEMGMTYGPSVQRTRAGTEAVYLLMRYAFEKLHNRRLEWKCDRLNAASVRSAQRYGFVQEACLRQHHIVKGRNRDTLYFSMLDHEWPTCKRALETWLEDTNFDQHGTQKRKLAEIRRAQSLLLQDAP